MKTGTLRIILLVALSLLIVLPQAQFVRAEQPGEGPLVASSLLEEAQEKADLRDRLRNARPVPGTRAGEAPDPSQVSIAGPIERGILPTADLVDAAYAYVQPYREPNDWAHRNYCGPGAAIVLLSHWDPNYPREANIDQIGREMGIDPNMGVWVYRMVKPINERLNQMLGQELNWYRYGEARSLYDLRWMIDVDIRQTAAPFITALMTRGLPGWGSRNVGHIVAVYGYTQTADGREYVNYVDTAPPIVGYNNWILNVWELNDFWRAVSGNSGQVW